MGGAMSQFGIDAIVLGERDSNNRSVLDIYARQADRYAVYQTEQRVVIAYSDDPLVQKIQRRRLATLAMLRSEIDGMLGPWREKSGRSRLVQTARQFDMRVASALIEALEGEAETARAILETIKADIAGEMASRARLAYVLWSMASALVVFGICILAYVIAGASFGETLIKAADRSLLLAGMGTGVLGALYSIAIRIEQRTLNNDLRRLDGLTDSFVRLGLGAIGAFILGCFLISGAIEINFGTGIRPGADGRAGPNFIYLVLIGGFVAGFVERLVPDLLNSYSITAHAPEPPKVSAPPATKPTQPAPGSASTAAEGSSIEDEDALTSPPREDDGIDGCDAHLDDPALSTADEDLPPTSGGVAVQ